MDEYSKKKIEEINKIYQDVINSETNREKEKQKNLWKSLNETAEERKKEKFKLLNKSFNGVQSSISDMLTSEIPNNEIYIEKYSDIAKDIKEDKNFSKATKDLLSLTEDINKDKFRYEIQKINEREPILDTKNHQFPDVPNYGKIITDSLKNQKDSLVLVVNHLEEQTLVLKDQIEKSDLSFKEQLDKSKKSMYWTIGIAVVSIFIAISTTMWSVYQSKEIYNKENNSSDIQHNELKQILKESANTSISLDTEQLNVLSKILESLNKKKINNDKNIAK